MSTNSSVTSSHTMLSYCGDSYIQSHVWLKLKFCFKVKNSSFLPVQPYSRRRLSQGNGGSPVSCLLFPPPAPLLRLLLSAHSWVPTRESHILLCKGWSQLCKAWASSLTVPFVSIVSGEIEAMVPRQRGHQKSHCSYNTSVLNI